MRTTKKETEIKLDEVQGKEPATPTTIWKAIADFQQDVPIIHKDTLNAFAKYTYADIAKVIQVIMPYLKKHNLGFIQPLQGDSIQTIIFHTETGEQVESITRIPQGVQLKGMNEFQVYGSAVTYFRRYSLASILGLVTDKDLDAGGEQTAPSKNLDGLSNERFDNAVEAIKTGKYTKEELLQNYLLTTTQKLKLNEL
jgi:hypothetical protein